MSSQLDELLGAIAVEPPEGFVERVMAQVRAAPTTQRRHTPPWWPWAAVTCAAALGLGELGSFMFAAWIAVAAN